MISSSITTYGYDAAGRLESVADAEGNEITIVWNQLGMVKFVTVYFSDRVDRYCLTILL